jgi:hypothetical protein
MSDDRPQLPASGWYQDPTGQGDARYWDGQAWTDSVSRQGTTFHAPMDQAQTHIPPIPGTEFRAAPAATPAPAPPQSVNVTQTAPPGRSPVGAILGAIIAVAVVVLIVVLAVSLTGDDDDDQDDTTEQEDTGEQQQPDDSGGGSEPEVPVEDSTIDG